MCQGYAQKAEPKRSLKTVRTVCNIAPKEMPPMKVLQTPRSKLFASDEEYRYFCLFREKTASTLAGYFKDSLWSRLVLQACETTPSVRHAIIAIGALDMTLNATQSGQCFKVTSRNGEGAVRRA